MRHDVAIGLLVGIGGVFVGVALMVAPSYLHLPYWGEALCFWGGIGLALICFTIAVRLGFLGTETPLRLNRKKLFIFIPIGSVIVLAGMYIIWRGMTPIQSDKSKDESEIIKPQSALTEALKKRPEVDLRFVYPKSPALIITNKSASTASDIKWIVKLWNMNHPENDEPLPIPENRFDWVYPNNESGPINIFDNPQITSLLKPGDQLFGMAAVNCVPCSKGSTYVLSIVWGKGGWFAKTDADGTPLLPSNLLKNTRDGYFKSLEELAPEQSRIMIENEKTPVSPHVNLTASFQCLFRDDKMIFVNDGANDFYIWGYKLGERKFMMPQAQLVPTKRQLEFKIGTQKKWIQENYRPKVAGGFMPSEVYLTDVSKKKKFLGNFTIDTISVNGSIAIRVFTVVPVTENSW